MDKIEMFAVVFGAAWTFFKTTSFLFMRRSANTERLFNALEVGVSAAWEEIVKPWVEKNEEGAPLPAHIRQAAETRAIEAATAVDKIVKKFPRAVIRATLKAAVEEAKRRGAK